MLCPAAIRGGRDLMRLGRSIASCACALLLLACGGNKKTGQHGGHAPAKTGAHARTSPSAARGALATAGRCPGIAAPVTRPTPRGAKIAVSIALADTGCTLAPDFAGNNYEAFAGWGADTSLSRFQQQAFTAAGIQLLRYPGGEPGNWTDLLMTGRCKDGSNANWNAPAFTALWDFARAAGVHALMLQTNPTPQTCADGAHDGSGASAARLAKHATARGVRAVYEIGNEPDIGDSWFSKNGGRDAYIARFIEHARAIHSAVPGAEVYGPALCGLGANCTFPTSWDSGWLDAFLARTGDKADGEGRGTVDGVSLHVYWHPEWGFSDLEEAGIGKHGFALYWANTMMPYLRALIARHDSRALPVIVSEISLGNGVAKDPAPKQNMFSVLATLDTIGAFAASGVRSFQWFDANAEGPADFSLITKDAARPTFYAFAAWARMGNHVLAVRSDASPVSLGAYATKKPDGSVQVLLINKTDSAHDVALTFEGFDPQGKPIAIHSGSPGGHGGERATSVVYNGQPSPLPDLLPPPRRAVVAERAPVLTVTAYSFAVVELGPQLDPQPRPQAERDQKM
jgi:hypothetical protein